MSAADGEPSSPAAPSPAPAPMAPLFSAVGYAAPASWPPSAHHSLTRPPRPRRRAPPRPQTPPRRAPASLGAAASAALFSHTPTVQPQGAPVAAERGATPPAPAPAPAPPPASPRAAAESPAPVGERRIACSLFAAAALCANCIRVRRPRHAARGRQVVREADLLHGHSLRGRAGEAAPPHRASGAVAGAGARAGAATAGFGAGAGARAGASPAAAGTGSSGRGAAAAQLAGGAPEAPQAAFRCAGCGALQPRARLEQTVASCPASPG